MREEGRSEREGRSEKEGRSEREGVREWESGAHYCQRKMIDFFSKNDITYLIFHYYHSLVSF